MKHIKNFCDCFPGIFAATKKDPSATTVYLYIAHHFCLTPKKSIAISLEEIQNGAMLDNGIGLSKNTIREAIECLKDKGLLKTKKGTFKSSLYKPLCPSPDGSTVSVFDTQEKVLRSDIDSEEGNGSKTDSVTLGVKNRPMAAESQSQKLTPSKGRVFTSLTERKTLLTSSSPTVVEEGCDPFKVYAAQLSSALAKKNKIMRRVVLGQWAKAIKLFFANTEVTTARFEKALNWYCENMFSTKYIPRARSAKGFCDNFERIEDAMDRHLEDKRTVDSEEAVHYEEFTELTEEETRQLKESQSHLL